jgi:hypothetical protein
MTKEISESDSELNFKDIDGSINGIFSEASFKQKEGNFFFFFV